METSDARGAGTVELTAEQERALALSRARQRLEDQKSVVLREEGAPTKGRGTFASVMDGLTFGFSDEIASGLYGLKEAAVTSGGLSERYKAFDESSEIDFIDRQIRRDQFSSEHPSLSFVGEVGGGLAQGGGLFSMGKQLLKNVPPLARLVGVGAAEGAAFGAGTSLPGQRLEGAGEGALFGAVGTPLLAGATNVTSTLFSPAARRLRESLLGTPKNKAVREILGAMDADDITSREAFQLLSEMGPDAVLADLGENLGRLTRVSASQTGPAAGRARRFLDERQLGQQMRLRQAARTAVGSNDFDKGIIEIVNGAESQAADLYREAYSQIVDVSPQMMELMSRPAMKSARRKATTILQNEGFDPDLNGDITDVRYLDAVKRALDDQIGVTVRQGNRNQSRILTNLKTQFVSEIDNQVPVYAQARSIFGGEAAIRDAAELGRTMFRSNKLRVSDVAEQVQGMGDGELQALRIGFLDDLAETLSKQGETRNTAKRLVEVPRFKQMAQLVFPDKDALQQFMNRASAESTFSQTRNLVLGGSPTARIQADRMAATDSITGLLFDGMTNPSMGIAQAIRSTMNNSKLTDEVLEEMGNILLDPNVVPEALIARRMPNPLRFNPITRTGLLGGAVGSQVGLLEPTGGVVASQVGESNPYIDKKRETQRRLLDGESLGGTRDR